MKILIENEELKDLLANFKRISHYEKLERLGGKIAAMQEEIRIAEMDALDDYHMAKAEKGLAVDYDKLLHDLMCLVNNNKAGSAKYDWARKGINKILSAKAGIEL